MRELTSTIRFTKASLGDVKARQKEGSFLMPRNPQGSITFMATWHQSNMRFAAQVLGRHSDEIVRISWDIAVVGDARRGSWYRRYYQTTSGKTRYASHECFEAGQQVGIRCVVPPAIGDDDFWQLMEIAGRYRGLSPYRPREFGFYEMVALSETKRKPDPESPESSRAGAAANCSGSQADLLDRPLLGCVPEAP